MIQSSDAIDNRSSIFRDEALRRYGQSRDRSVLPRFVSTLTVTWLWILCGLLLVAGLVVCFVPVPVYSSGNAIVTHSPDLSSAAQDSYVLAVFLPAENLAELRIGQNLFIKVDGHQERISVPITSIESEIASPENIRQRFSFVAEIDLLNKQPVTVATAQLSPLLAGLPASSYSGAVLAVEAEIGSERFISRFLRIDSLLGQD